MHFDLVAGHEDRDRENFTLASRDSHRWYAYADMQPREVILRKDFDSDQSAPQGVFHAAAIAQGSDLRRRSLEVRLIAFFEESGTKAAEAEMLSPKVSMRNRQLIGMLPPHE
ncbi:unnamed protein product [Prorocentrum cordatum]|uniref:Uncharacterized protein n=1 Tax=Prorocentrum cordatum TaxID=2364126 RepID=A0ABN9XBU0_9DINO|nr:unnamed protein product [Polarella glacialis]